MGKVFARLTQYGDVCIPVKLLEQIVEQGYIVHTTYDSGNFALSVSKVEHIKDAQMVNESEIKAVLAQQELSKDE